MLVPNPSTQPDQPTVPPTRKHSQVTSEQINQHSKSPSQELRHSPRASPQPNIKKGNCLPAKATKTQSQPKLRFRPPSSVKKKSQWGDSKPEPEQASQSHNHPGSCVMNKVKAKSEEEWKAASRE